MIASLSKPTPLDALAPDPCPCGMGAGCACLPAERALRWLSNGHGSMTSDQRAWCLDEIDQVEGYERADYEHEHDCDVAMGVLSAWRDFCRDKGLL